MSMNFKLVLLEGKLNSRGVTSTDKNFLLGGGLCVKLIGLS